MSTYQNSKNLSVRVYYEDADSGGVVNISYRITTSASTLSDIYSLI
jgi:acyl-CoA thioesterase FadM